MPERGGMWSLGVWVSRDVFQHCILGLQSLCFGFALGVKGLIAFRVILLQKLESSCSLSLLTYTDAIVELVDLTASLLFLLFFIVPELPFLLFYCLGDFDFLLGCGF
jgi:energy-coupling factor transporter transmembrane protein EcfT